MEGSVSDDGSASAAGFGSAAGSASSMAWSASSWGVSSSGKATSSTSSHQEPAAFTWDSMASSTEALGLYYSSSEWWPRLACVVAAALPTSPTSLSSPTGRSAASSPAARCSPATRSAPCCACKASKRGCTADCELAPYFPAHEREVFDIVHKLFSAKRMAVALTRLRPEKKAWYVRSRIAEAYARTLDPVLGLKGVQISLEAELGVLERQLAGAKELAGIRSPATAAAPTSPSRQTCAACASMRRNCTPCCPLAKLFPTADLYTRGCEMFGNDGVDRLAEILGSLDGENPHPVSVPDPVGGAVALVRALLGGRDGGVPTHSSVRSDATAFLHWMLQMPVAQAAPSPISATTVTRGSRCGACKTLQTKCTDSCTFAPYFPAAKADQFVLVRQEFDLSYIRDMLQGRNNKVPQERMEECVASLVQVAKELNKGNISGCVPSISLLMRKLLKAHEQLTLADVLTGKGGVVDSTTTLHKRDGSVASPPAVTSAHDRGVRKEASTSTSTSSRDGVPHKKARFD